MDDEGKSVRAAVMRLVPMVAREGQRIVDTIGEQQRLHQTDVEALSCIIRAEAQGRPLSAGVLGNELGLSSGATTFLMTRLERARLIERKRDEDDRRRVYLRLSAAGRSLADALYPPILRASDAVMDAFTTAELEVVERFLAATSEAMAAYRTSLTLEAADRLT